ncbi:hypothetical protein ACVTYA_13680 [Enterococcus hirae]|uniref:hypothetical protein n=1 Tax=Enterococcus sp. AZ152 TaxID=2774848 RepID=UPI00363437F7
MAKLKDLEKKQQKVEKELEKAKVSLEKAKQIVKTKEEELKCLNAELITKLLVENNMTMSDLTAMFSEDDGQTTKEELRIQEESGYENGIANNES